MAVLTCPFPEFFSVYIFPVYLSIKGWHFPGIGDILVLMYFPRGGAAVKKSAISNTIITVFLILEGLIYAVFLTLDFTGHGSQTIWIKYSGILLCLLFALLCALRGGDRLVFPAMIFTAAADWFLLVRGDHLGIGVALFLVVQSIYLVRLRKMGAGTAIWLRVLLPLLFGITLVFLRAANPLFLLVALYFSQLVSNTVLAWRTKRWMYAVGMTLFIFCDICVGMFNIGLALSFSSKAMWLFYLPSQVLIVLTARKSL